MERFSKLAIGQKFAIDATEKDGKPTTVTGRKVTQDVFEDSRTGLWFVVHNPETCEVITF